MINRLRGKTNRLLKRGSEMKETLVQSVEKILVREGYILDDRLPIGATDKIAKILRANKGSVKATIVTIRKNRNRKARPSRQRRTKKSILHKPLKDVGLLMGAPGKWRFAINIIIREIRKLPEGGFAVFLGSPSALSVSDHPNYKYEVITDEYNVAYILSLTTRDLRIEIGDEINKEKAEEKANLWRCLGTFNSAKIRTRAIHRQSFINIVDQVANRALKNNTMCKVVLVTSGHWNGSKNATKKYHGMDLGFKSASIELTTLYSNLHIYTAVLINHHDFKAVHVHNGKEKILNAQPVPGEAGH